MSRYRPDPRYSAGDLAYRDAPPQPQRWDRDSFAREQDYRGPPPVERPPYDDYRSPPRAAAPVYERERFYEEDRYGPRGQRTERRVFEEDDYYREDPRASRGAMIPFQPERPARPAPPVRPGQLIRRQSSLDTFDRRPQRRYDDYNDHRAPPPGRYDRPRPSQAGYDEVRVQDPEQYGDDGFREYREREWVRRRRRSNSNSRSRSRSRDRRSEFVEEVKEEKVEKSYPRKGKTRMPRRLVHTKVLYDLGYPYYEEDERTILIEKALGPENIDQVFTMSKEYRERETSTTRLLEAPPPEPFIVAAPQSVREEKFSEREFVRTVPISEAPRSVREWDGLSVRSPSPKSHRSHRSRSRRRSRRGSSPGTTVREAIIEKIIEKDLSPARTHRTSIRDLSPAHTHRTRRRSRSSGSETIIEKTKIISDEEAGESNSVHVGPLALVVDRHPSRSDRDIKDEIRRLETERRALRRERRYERDDEVVKIERVRDRSPSPRGEVIVERRGEELIEVKKDRRARARSRSVAPSPGVIKAMMATLT